MQSITAGPETKIFSNSDFVNLPIEALMVGVCGNMAAALDLDIRSQLLAISKGAQEINTLNAILQRVTTLQRMVLENGAVVAGKMSDADKATARGLGVTVADGGNELDRQKNISSIQQVLDSKNTISQDQSTRLQSLKEKYSQMYKLIAAFSKTVFDTSGSIINHTG